SCSGTHRSASSCFLGCRSTQCLDSHIQSRDLLCSVIPLDLQLCNDVHVAPAFFYFCHCLALCAFSSVSNRFSILRMCGGTSYSKTNPDALTPLAIFIRRSRLISPSAHGSERKAFHIGSTDSRPCVRSE